MAQNVWARHDARVVLVTGGGAGIGRAVAEAFLDQGDEVVILDRDVPVDLDCRAHAIVGDVCDGDANLRAVNEALSQFGRLDVFIANAGVHDGGLALSDLEPSQISELFERVFAVNVVAYALGARAAVEALKASHGCLVFTLSDASFVVRGNGSGAAYAASKHAALGLMRHLAADLAPNVRVNGVAPGGVVTSLRAVGPEGSERGIFDDTGTIEDEVRSFNPLGVLLTPTEVAQLYTFLASEAAAGMTGEVLRPDGGLAIR